jgi:Tfp pilus assembly protein PilO
MKIKNRQQLLTILALTVIGLFAADRLIISPLTDAWSARAKRVKDLQQRVADGKSLIDRERALKGRWEGMQKNALPTTLSTAEEQIMNSFDAWRSRSGLNINSITPQWKHDDTNFMTLQCRIEGLGSMKSVARFLYEMENSPTALRLENLEIASKDTEGQSLTFGLTVSGLVLLEEGKQ